MNGLTYQEKTKIVQLLGYGAKTIQIGSVIYNKILNDRLDSVPMEAQDLVRQYLTQIQNIETQMGAATTRLIAKKVGDIELNNRELEDVRRERKRLSRELSDLLDIPYVGSGGVNVSVCI